MNRLWVRLSVVISLLMLIVMASMFAALIVHELHYRNDKESEQAIVEDRLGAFVPIILASGTIGILSGIWASRLLSKPIALLAEAATSIGSGDLARRVEVEENIQELVDLARAFNTMAANLQRAEDQRKNLMIDVSHELRTPLTILKGNLRAALDHVYDLNEAEIASLYEQTSHLIRLINDLHELALAESNRLPLNLQPTNLSDLLSEVALAFEPLAEEKQVRLVCQASDSLPPLWVDSSRIRQVLHNLIANALRHTPAQGCVTLRGTATDRDIRLAVEDTGVGIPPDHLPHVFDRFYRGDRSRSRETGGSGLGLAIVKAIVEAHQGCVTVHSEGLNRGTTFTLVFDKAKAARQ